MADIVFINPRFEVSYWGLEHAMPLFGKRATMPAAALPLLAALTPAGHTITIMDENIEAIDFQRIARADMVALTGMCVQRFRMKEILERVKSLGVFTVVGGPWVTVKEDYFGDLADVIFVGEAEETWPAFLREWETGKHEVRYEQANKTDVTQIPTPRFDLLKAKHYCFGSLQFSRGCPFQCEFCDIIVTFGRRPRLKTSTQVIAELEALRAQGMREVFIVDDNLIGNKKAIKVVLRDVIAYQEKNGFPFSFFTEASLDLAEDEELMRLMVDANIRTVFIGIESPNEDALKETKKFQNVRPVGTLTERVHRVQKSGLEVTCGMIVGFDSDGPNIFDLQRQFIRESRVVNVMLGMLTAIPKTPLYARLEAEGRLDAADGSPYGTNVIPKKMSREELREGYLSMMRDLNNAKSYFDRLDDLYLKGKIPVARGLLRFWKRNPFAWLKAQAKSVIASVVLYHRLMREVPEAELRREYRQRIGQLLRRRPNPMLVLRYLCKCAMQYHAHTMVRRMTAESATAVVNSF